MAKLNKMEMSAIADKIYNDIKEKVDNYNREIKSESNYKEWLKEYKKTPDYKLIFKTENTVKEFNEVFKKIENKRGYRNLSANVSDTEDILCRVFETTLNLKELKISRESIERDIIIAQAKNEDLEALIADLTVKYSV